MTKTLKISALALLTIGAFSLAAFAETSKQRGEHRSGDAKTEVTTPDLGKGHGVRHMLKLHGASSAVSGSDGGSDLSGTDDSTDTSTDGSETESETGDSGSDN